MKRTLIILAFIAMLCGASYAQNGDTADMYYYKNSLYNHLETGNSDANASTNVGNWIARFTAVPSNPKVATLGSVFGFFPQWSVPPKAHNFHSEITTPHLQKWTASWDGATEIDLLGFVPDNFDGQSFDPADTTNMGEAYVTKLLALIDEWEANAPNDDRRYVVYAGWPALNQYGGTNDDPGTLTASGIARWQAYGLGEYQDWMELLVVRLQEARPQLDIRLHNISKAVIMCHQNTVVKDIPANVLFEDLAPHGRATWYFLAAVAEYMEIFGEKPPSGFSFKSEWMVDSTVIENYQAIVDYIWSVVDDGQTSAKSALALPDIVNVYPNPVISTLSIKTAEDKPLTFSILSVTGEVILTGRLQRSLDVSNLQAGVYLLKIHDEHSNQTIRFIKN